MKNKTLPPAQRSGKKGGKFFPALCNFLGTLILVAVIVVSVPLSVPRFLGYEAYNVVSGSMEPELSVGSLVYVEPTDPGAIQPGEIAAFYSGDSVVTHRVLRNQFVENQLVTKGDANDMEDINPVRYSQVIGVVRYHIPELGRLLSIYASQVGKIYMLILAACGVMFNMLASRLRGRSREKELTRQLAAEDLSYEKVD